MRNTLTVMQRTPNTQPQKCYKMIFQLNGRQLKACICYATKRAVLNMFSVRGSSDKLKTNTWNKSFSFLRRQSPRLPPNKNSFQQFLCADFFFCLHCSPIRAVVSISPSFYSSYRRLLLLFFSFHSFASCLSMSVCWLILFVLSLRKRARVRFDGIVSATTHNWLHAFNIANGFTSKWNVCIANGWRSRAHWKGGAELWGRLKQCKISYWGADVEEAQRVLACKQTAIENYIYVTFRRSVALENVR